MTKNAIINASETTPHKYEHSELNNEKFAILQARKFAKYYARQLLLKNEFCEAMHKCETFAEMTRLCQHFFI